jgi:predicted Zn-dependent protease
MQIKNPFPKKIALVGLLILLGACQTVPISGRRQMTLLPGSEMQALSQQQYQQVLQKNRVVSQTQQSQQLKTVGRRMAAAVKEYMKEEGLEDQVAGYHWDFNLIAGNQVNAFAMPGGKVAFYEGIMPICATEAGIATVMGHEIAHVIARHGNERMSQGLVQQAGGMALSAAMKEKPAQTRQLWMTAYGVASQVGGILPFSRLHESEADHMGLIFMAMAGYDPRQAPEFWKRMKKQAGQQPPEFLSTHPSHNTRIAQLQKWMEEALPYYQPSAK